MRLYTKDHAWIEARGNTGRVGISDFAQSELGEIAYVELPAVGRSLARGEVACTVDSLKSSSEIYAPVGGTVTAVNDPLATEEHARLVNSDPLGAGWLFEIAMSDTGELDLLLTEDHYKAYISGG
jgi:glycine cleavage system H protein